MLTQACLYGYSQGMTTNTTPSNITTWTVTFRTGHSTWTTTTIEAADHETAIARAQRLLGGVFVKVI